LHVFLQVFAFVCVYVCVCVCVCACMCVRVCVCAGSTDGLHIGRRCHSKYFEASVI